MALNVPVGKSIHVTANMLDQNTVPLSKLPAAPTWASSDETVATVTAPKTDTDEPNSPTANRLKAKITALKAGTTNVTCTIGAVTGTLAVTVYAPTLTSITLT